MGHMSTATPEAIHNKRKEAAAKAWQTMRARRVEQQTAQTSLRQLSSQITLAPVHSGRCVCENCGLPDGARPIPGFQVQVTRKAENRFKRDSKATVWVCSRECGVQILGVSTYGKATSRWPISLEEFRMTVASMFRAALAQKAVN
jgi:hypothetical protein